MPIDSDNDTLTDDVERRLGTNPYDEDSDDDGLSDFAEQRLGTKPLDPDTDGDGAIDGTEVANRRDPVIADPYTSSELPRQPSPDDADGDGLSDVMEAFGGSDPDDPDTDGDGLGDGVESIRGTSTRSAWNTPAYGGTHLDDVAAELRHLRGGRAPDEVMAKAAGRDAFLEAARSQLGDPYRFGAEADLADRDPDAFDSSELVEWAAAQAGIKLPDGSWRQYRHLHEGGNSLPVDQALKTPGALVFGFSSDPLASTQRPARSFVAISVGDGRRVIDVSERAGVVREMDAGNLFTHAAVIPELAEDLDSDLDGAGDALERDLGTDPFDAADDLNSPPEPAPLAPTAVPDAVTSAQADEAPPAPVDDPVATAPAPPAELDVTAQVDVATDAGMDGEVENEVAVEAEPQPEVEVWDEPVDVTDELTEQLWA